MRLIAALIAAVLLCAAGSARAQTDLIAGYADHPTRGPAEVKGAVIYSHGLARVAESAGEAPFVADRLWDGGWDVYRLQRRWAGDEFTASTAALVAAVKRLRAQGYRRVVLVGQSFGGWISLAAAHAEDVLIDAVVAFAPAAYGDRDEDPNWRRNATALYPLVEKMMTPRALVFSFAEDPYEPEGRATRLREILSARAIAAAVVERPGGLTGHEAGITRAFARRYGDCIRAFIEAVPPPTFFTCPEETPAIAVSEFRAPEALQVRAAPPDAPARLAALAGRWYGYYPQGREILLTIDEVGRDRALAVYAFGPIARDGDEREGFTRRRGEYDEANSVLRFAEPQADLIMECRLLDDGRMELAGLSRTTDQRLYAILRRPAVKGSP